MNGFIQRNEKSVQNEYSHSTETKNSEIERDLKRKQKDSQLQDYRLSQSHRPGGFR